MKMFFKSILFVATIVSVCILVFISSYLILFLLIGLAIYALFKGTMFVNKVREDLDQEE